MWRGASHRSVVATDASPTHTLANNLFLGSATQKHSGHKSTCFMCILKNRGGSVSKCHKGVRWVIGEKYVLWPTFLSSFYFTLLALPGASPFCWAENDHPTTETLPSSDVGGPSAATARCGLDAWLAVPAPFWRHLHSRVQPVGSPWGPEYSLVSMGWDPSKVLRVSQVQAAAPGGLQVLESKYSTLHPCCSQALRSTRFDTRRCILIIPSKHVEAAFTFRGEKNLAFSKITLPCNQSSQENSWIMSLCLLYLYPVFSLRAKLKCHSWAQLELWGCMMWAAW